MFFPIFCVHFFIYDVFFLAFYDRLIHFVVNLYCVFILHLCFTSSSILPSGPYDLKSVMIRTTLTFHPLPSFIGNAAFLLFAQPEEDPPMVEKCHVIYLYLESSKDLPSDKNICHRVYDYLGKTLFATLYVDTLIFV